MALDDEWLPDAEALVGLARQWAKANELPAQAGGAGGAPAPDLTVRGTIAMPA